MPYYKGFDKDLCCWGKQYAIGEVACADDGPLTLHSKYSLHFSENINDTFNYYCPFDTFDASRYCEVEPIGEVKRGCVDRAAKSLRVIREVDPVEICGWDLTGAREFFKRILDMKWIDGHGKLPDGVQLFETKIDAIAAFNAEKDRIGLEAWYAGRNCALNSGFDIMSKVVRDASRAGADEAIWQYALSITWAEDMLKKANGSESSMSLFCALRYVCADLDIPKEVRDHAELRWSVWESGYGVLGDMNGLLYCYKKSE